MGGDENERSSTTHRVYMDDSGTKEYALAPTGYGRTGNTRHFVFGAVLIAVPQVRVLVPKIKAAKQAVFGTSDVEIKSNWLRIPTERQKRYLNKYRITDADLRRFVDAYYDELDRAEFQFIAGVVDKQQMQETYPKPWYPSAVCYELVVQRVEDELSEGRGTYSIFVDDMTGATPANNQYRKNLAAQHAKMRVHGSGLMRDFKFTGVRGDLKFVDSRSSELVQVADVAAYNVFRQFTEHPDAWEDPTLSVLPTYDYFERLTPKFRSDANGRIQGYGVAKMPRRGRRHWVAKNNRQGAP